MNTFKIYLILFLVVLCFNCSNKKQLLDPEQKEELVSLSSDELFTGERKNEVRQIDTQNPPVLIDMTGVIEEKQLELSTYFPSQKILKLQHPKKEEGYAFKYLPPGAGVAFVPNLPFPSAKITLIHKDWILVGNLSGLFCFTKEGKYLFTLTESEQFKDVEMSSVTGLNSQNATNLLAGVSMQGDICLFATISDGESTMHFFDLVQGKEIHQVKLPATRFTLLNASHKTILDYNYWSAEKVQKPFMYSFTANGDTLCSFQNHNAIVEYKRGDRGSASSLYYIGDKLHIHQAGNDTIFRMASEYELNPAYIFQTGERRASMEDIIKRQAKGKYAINDIVDTNKLLIFTLVGSDELYSYDKEKKKVFRSSNLTGLGIKEIFACDDVLYTSFDKQEIPKVLEKAPTSSMADALKGLDAELEDGEVAVVIMQ